jgi:hypothetical protein
VAYDFEDNIAAGFNLAFSHLVTGLAPGSHTLTLQWEVQAPAGAYQIYSLANSGASYDHRTVSAIEF